MASGFSLDTSQFNRALAEYIRVSKRTLPEIVNKRSVNVAFLALRRTKSARPGRIERDLRRRVSVPGRKGRGRPPRAALLVQKGGKHSPFEKPSPGLYGADMRAAIDLLIQKRQRTRAYIKSGFLKSARDIQRGLKGPSKRPPRNLNTFSKQPGEGRKARPGLNPTAEIINYATGADKVAGPALQAALNADADDMKRFAAKRMQQDANKFNTR